MTTAVSEPAPRTVVPCWGDSGVLVAAAIEALPALVDDDAAALVEHLALELVRRDEELRAVRAVLSVSMEACHVYQRDVTRARARVATLLDERRSSQISTAR